MWIHMQHSSSFTIFFSSTFRCFWQSYSPKCRVYSFQMSIQTLPARQISNYEFTGCSKSSMKATHEAIWGIVFLRKENTSLPPKKTQTKPTYLLYTNKVPSMSVFSYKRQQLHLRDMLVHRVMQLLSSTLITEIYNILIFPWGLTS